MSKEEYCLSPYFDDDGTDILLPLNCYMKSVEEEKGTLYGYTFMFSVPFMILTIIVYMVLPELRTLHGISLCCYLAGLSIGYSILTTFIFFMGSLSDLQCASLGFLAYYAFMASFCWLSVISFDLFYNILTPSGRRNEKKRLVLYSVYAWGSALILVGLTYAAQQSSFIPHDWKPQIGSAERCWLQVRVGWSALLYFYGPTILIIGFNTAMFILTARRINAVQKETKRMLERKESQRSIRSEKDKFGIFLRLFIVMGVTWSMEIASYIVGEETFFSKFFILTDILNAIQGFLIFVLFVMRKKIKQYLHNRLFSDRKGRHGHLSCRTTNSSTNIPMTSITVDKPLVDNNNQQS